MESSGTSLVLGINTVFSKKQEFAKNIHNAQMSLWMERLFAMCVFGCCEKSVMNDTGIDSVKEAA